MSYLLELHDKILDAERQVSEAKKVLSKKTDELKELENLVWFCPNCEKNYPKESVTRCFREVTGIETVYTDSGYGDDDEIAEVTRLVPFLQCPVCGQSCKAGIGSKLHEKNRHTRR